MRQLPEARQPTRSSWQAGVTEVKLVARWRVGGRARVPESFVQCHHNRSRYYGAVICPDLIFGATIQNA